MTNYSYTITKEQRTLWSQDMVHFLKWNFFSQTTILMNGMTIIGDVNGDDIEIIFYFKNKLTEEQKLLLDNFVLNAKAGSEPDYTHKLDIIYDPDFMIDFLKTNGIDAVYIGAGCTQTIYILNKLTLQQIDIVKNALKNFVKITNK